MVLVLPVISRNLLFLITIFVLCIGAEAIMDNTADCLGVLLLDLTKGL